MTLVGGAISPSEMMPGRNLIEILEEMMVVPRNHLDVDIGSFEALAALQPAEARTDDDDLVPIRWCCTGMAPCVCSSPTPTGQPPTVSIT